MNKHRSLKNMVLVERAFRMRQMWRILALTLVSVLISTVALAFFYSHMLSLFAGGDMPLYFAPENMETLTQNIPGMQETMIQWLLILGGINAVVTVIAATFMTYKLGGPLYRLKADMDVIGQGDLSKRIHLRQGDEYQDVATSINTSVQHLDDAVANIHAQLAAFQDIHLHGAEQEKLEQAISQMQSSLDYFTVSKPK